jgi:hypothetical protein
MAHEAIDSICIGFRSPNEVELAASLINTLNTESTSNVDVAACVFSAEIWHTALRSGLMEEHAASVLLATTTMSQAS